MSSEIAQYQKREIRSLTSKIAAAKRRIKWQWPNRSRAQVRGKIRREINFIRQYQRSREWVKTSPSAYFNQWQTSQ